jgi:hypothetical protein
LFSMFPLRQEHFVRLKAWSMDLFDKKCSGLQELKFSMSSFSCHTWL